MNNTIAATMMRQALTKEAGFGSMLGRGLSGAARGIGRGAKWGAKRGWGATKAVGRQFANDPVTTGLMAVSFGPELAGGALNLAGNAYDGATNWAGNQWNDFWHGKDRHNYVQRPRSNGGPLDMAYNFFGSPQGMGTGIGAAGGAGLAHMLGLPWWAGGLVGGGLGYLGGNMAAGGGYR